MEEVLSVMDVITAGGDGYVPDDDEFPAIPGL